MKPLEECSIGMIGAGKMASVLARGWINAGLAPASNIAAFDIDSAALQRASREIGITAANSNRNVCAGKEIIVIATKPAAVVGALLEVAEVLRAGQLVVSIAAGVTLAQIEGALPEGVAAIRVMPSTPCLVGAGASAYSRGHGATAEQAEIVGRLFRAVGTAVELPESQMDAVTGLSGSGPAYIFIIIEALADGGVRAGLDRATALQLAAQTVLGSAKLVLETGEHPARLKDQVASPAGTTIAGIGVLESRGVRGALMDAVAAGAARSAELGTKK